MGLVAYCIVSGHTGGWIVERDSMPDALEIVAVAKDDPGEVHAVRHREHPVYGVQFHPESIMTPQGKALLRNFLELAR